MWCSPTGGSSWPRLPISVIRRWKRERHFLFYGYQGDRRPETAELVVRRRHLGTASNDLGFARTPQGYVPIVSDYDQRTLQGGQFLVKLRTAYSEQVVAEVTRRLRGTARRTVEGHLVKIQVRY
jgi:hypothetical protein